MTKRGKSKDALVTTAGMAASIQSGQRQDFTYKSLVNQHLTRADFRHSLFTGGVFKNCNFSSTNFDRCDFAGTTFVECRFENCSFKPAEIRSCFLQKCAFINCDFGASQWDRSQIADTDFELCNFSESSIREATFSSSRISQCSLKMSSITLDRFTGCEFVETDFADCTALFLFFDICNFQNCRINAETLGFTYGLTRENLNNVGLVHLGQSQAAPQGELIESLVSTYNDRHWYIGAAALNLNFQIQPPVNVILDLTERLSFYLTDTAQIDWDELQFFTRVLQRLHEVERLPLLGLWSFSRFAAQAREKMSLNFPAARGFAPAPELVLSQLQALLDCVLDAMLGLFVLQTGTRKQLILQWTLSERPVVTINELVPWKAFEKLGLLDADLIDARSGSWIEAWQLSVNALLAIQISIACVTGLTHQMVKLKEDFHILMPSFLKRSERDKSKRPGAVLSSKPTLMSALLSRNQLSTVQSVAAQREGVEILDNVLSALERFPEGRLEAFLAYDSEHSLELSIKIAAPARVQSRRSSASAKRLRPPKPASSKRSKFTRKAKP